MNLEFHWEGGRLRLYDPVGERWLQNMTEMAEEAETERAARESVETAMKAERVARESAEARLAEMEAELRRLRGE